MKNYLLSGVAALGLLAAGAASAADLPARKGPVMAPVYAPVFTWTGFYVGANAGYGWGNVNAGTTFATSARPSFWRWASTTSQCRFSSAMRTAARSSCRATGTRRRTPHVSGY